MTMTFSQADLWDVLEQADAGTLDTLDFGVVGMSREGLVERYNRNEASRAGLSPSRVIGRHFFIDVAPCANTPMVAARFEEQESLDETLPYVFAFRMRPTRVVLRLLKATGDRRRYLLVKDA